MMRFYISCFCTVCIVNSARANTHFAYTEMNDFKNKGVDLV